MDGWGIIVRALVCIVSAALVYRLIWKAQGDITPAAFTAAFSAVIVIGLIFIIPIEESAKIVGFGIEIDRSIEQAEHVIKQLDDSQKKIETAQKAIVALSAATMKTLSRKCDQDSINSIRAFIRAGLLDDTSVSSSDISNAISKEILMNAIGACDSIDVLVELVKNEFPVNKIMLDHGRYSLHEAALWLSDDAIKILLSEPHDIDQRDKDGWTPLMYAVFSAGNLNYQDNEDYLEVVKIFIDNNADCNASSTKKKSGDVPIGPRKHFENPVKGTTPLTLAARYGTLKLVHVLLSNASITAKDENGLTAIDHAKVRQDEDGKRIVSLLSSINVEPTQTNKDKVGTQ